MEEIEFITLIGGLVVFGFIFLNRVMLARLPRSTLLISAYIVYLMGWVMNVVESYIFPVINNIFEHALYAIGSILLCAWCYIRYKRRDSHEP